MLPIVIYSSRVSPTKLKSNSLLLIESARAGFNDFFLNFRSVTEFSKKIKIFTETKKIWRNVIAAIVQTTDGDLNSAKVVVLASGTKTIDGENIHHEGTVHDSHAEIIARRALMFYFYDQLDLMCDESSQGGQ